MDALVDSINSQAVLVIAAIAVAFLLVKLLFRILKVSFGLLLTILAIVLVLQYGFGFTPGQLWGEIANLPQDLIQLVQSFDPNAITSMFSN